MGKYGLLTEKQYEVLKLRAKGLTQAEVASRLGMSRSAVAIAEKRALRKIELAAETLRVYREIMAVKVITLDEGVRLVDVPRTVIDEADKAGVKVKANFDYIFGLLRFKAGAGYPRLKKKVKIYLMRDGSIDVEETG
ncbi:Putative transcriptional regulatory protein [Thermogladius calderae 1633]|uniref:Putative transcriptional regulatory protein n=1 Tax=Thermogladius calderae (strain DSM 22663 / VKM B-2946 / 1633) TaxID=1184251 RepID=I3TFY3_THEC1|nr:Tfx family DNA-binding protein [Thermogladius calderae]AFK51671.1 Putative transcriptional regulatory protein [Thermogladius calderae 1633]